MSLFDSASDKMAAVTINTAGRMRKLVNARFSKGTPGNDIQEAVWRPLYFTNSSEPLPPAQQVVCANLPMRRFPKELREMKYRRQCGAPYASRTGLSKMTTANCVIAVSCVNENGRLRSVLSTHNRNN